MNLLKSEISFNRFKKTKQESSEVVNDLKESTQNAVMETITNTEIEKSSIKSKIDPLVISHVDIN
jgi:hypothetical protein